MSDAALEQARSAGGAILTGMGHHVEGWQVFGAEWVDQLVVRVVFGPAGARETEMVGAHFPRHLPMAAAVAELASQIQDHVCEVVWGEAIPPCPGHAHPLTSHVAGGIAVWECPENPEHHRVPVVSDARAS